MGYDYLINQDGEIEIEVIDHETSEVIGKLKIKDLKPGQKINLDVDAEER